MKLRKGELRFAKTHQYFDRPGSGAFMPNHFAELELDDPSWFRDGTIWHELTPLDNESVIYKPSYGAFYDTPLETILINLAKDTVIVCCGTTA